ncbi:MAG TPA: transporter [Oxalobacteraceae bacterium]|nr:transporter [Oxalobacteraceae bacterium]
MKHTSRPVRCSLQKCAALSLFSIATLSLSNAVYASGFSLNEMSAASVGNALAGGAAAAEDIGTIYYNPAGLARMSGKQFMVVGSAIRPSSKFSNSGSISAAGTPMTGGNGGDAGGLALVPAMYFAMDLTPRLRFGIGLQSPFGLKTEYDAGWSGRYHALTSDMKTININPSLSYKLNDKVALGAGISAQYVDVKLSKAIDFGSICFGTFGAGAAAICGPGGFLPQARDGVATVKGDDWGFGFNLGILLTPTESTRIGIAYRSQIRHTLSGQATYDKPAGLPAPLAASATFTNTAASADLTLPESLSLSGHMEIDPKWTVMGDISWMRWSRFEELRVRFANGAADSVTPERWRNTVRYSVATNYRYNDAWKVRLGVAYDPTPLKDEFRTARVPDADRTWLSLGAQFKPSPQEAWDIGYAHIFIKDGPINKTEAGAGRQTGNYKNKVDILSVQYSRSF